MSVVPEDFLGLAKQVDLSVNKEIEVRNAISRAYYAAYHQTRKTFPADKEFAKNSGFGVHEAYIEQLMQFDPGTPERITAVKLKTMKGRRSIADYRLDDDVRAFTAAQQNSAAEEVFSILAVIKNNESEVAEEVEVYSMPERRHDPDSVGAQRPTLMRLK